MTQKIVPSRDTQPATGVANRTKTVRLVVRAKQMNLRACLNEVFDCELLMSYGSLLQITGPAYESG